MLLTKTLIFCPRNRSTSTAGAPTPDQVSISSQTAPTTSNKFRDAHTGIKTFCERNCSPCGTIFPFACARRSHAGRWTVNLERVYLEGHYPRVSLPCSGLEFGPARQSSWSYSSCLTGAAALPLQPDRSQGLGRRRPREGHQRGAARRPHPAADAGAELRDREGSLARGVDDGIVEEVNHNKSVGRVIHNQGIYPTVKSNCGLTG